ncbi:MAG: CBS domain-containing protein [Actinomycetota bacterium]|nr:CBS domain-containing protein [Actinomycetota bacterium]
MATAAEMMHAGVTCVGEDDTLDKAARIMRSLHVGALPICGADNRLKGMVTDRDIVVRAIAEGSDVHTTTARQMAQGQVVSVDTSADQDEVLGVMKEHRIRRLPVLDGKQLVGMISEADLARHLSHDQLSDFVETVYSAPPTN